MASRKKETMKFTKEYLSRRLNAHTQKAKLYLLLRIHVYLNKHGKANILILYTRMEER